MLSSQYTPFAHPERAAQKKEMKANVARKLFGTAKWKRLASKMQPAICIERTQFDWQASQ